LLKLFSYFQPKCTWCYIRGHLGGVPAYDTSRIRRELGLEVRPFRASVLDTLADLRQRGLIRTA